MSILAHQILPGQKVERPALRLRTRTGENTQFVGRRKKATKKVAFNRGPRDKWRHGQLGKRGTARMVRLFATMSIGGTQLIP